MPANPFTVTGRMLVLASASALFVVINSSLALLLSLLLWLLITSFLCGLIFRPRLKVVFNSDDLRIKGEPTTLEVTVINVSSLAAYDLYLRFPDWSGPLRIEPQLRTISVLEAGEQTTIVFQLECKERGEHRLPSVQIVSLFPFGMFRFVSQADFEHPIVVAPAFQIRSMNDFVLNEVDARLNNSLSHLRREFEYVGSLEFREGMQVRRWDFTAWARLGIPAIREFKEIRNATATLVVDVNRVNTSLVDEDFEQLLSRVACTCASLVEQNYQVSLAFVGREVEFVDAFQDRNALDTLLRALAMVEVMKRTESWTAAWTQIENTITNDAVVFAFLRSEEARAEMSSINSQLLNHIIVDLPSAALKSSTISAPHFNSKTHVAYSVKA